MAELFISYSRKDKKWLDKIETHLGSLSHSKIRYWYDSNIEPGRLWEQDLVRHIQNAQIALCLISKNYLNSNYIRQEEIPLIRNTGMIIIPFLIDDCAWKEVGWLSKIQILPKDSNPLKANKEEKQDGIIVNLVKNIVETINQLKVQSPRIENKKKHIEIPIVVVAMTEKESEFLINGEYSGSDFQMIKEIFTEEDFIEWRSNYKEDRNCWRPYINENRTIKRIVADMAFIINKDYKYNGRVIYPKFVTESFFDTEEKGKQHAIWKKLITSGGIVIIDLLSLFHPSINRIFSESTVSSHNEIAIICFFPMSKSSINAYSLIKEQPCHILWGATERFSKEFDQLCEFKSNSPESIQRLLYYMLRKKAIDKISIQANPKKRIKLRDDRNKEPSGIVNVILGRGVN